MRWFLQLRVRGRGALCKLRLSLTETDKLFMRSSQLEGCAPNPPSPPPEVRGRELFGCRLRGCWRAETEPRSVRPRTQRVSPAAWISSWTNASVSWSCGADVRDHVTRATRLLWIKNAKDLDLLLANKVLYLNTRSRGKKAFFVRGNLVHHSRCSAYRI